MLCSLVKCNAFWKKVWLKQCILVKSDEKIREFVPLYIFPLNPDYVAARSLRSLPSNKLTKDKFAEPAQACCKLLVSRLSPRSQQAVAATKPKIGEPKILHSILSLFQTISISCFLFRIWRARSARKTPPLSPFCASG